MSLFQLLQVGGFVMYILLIMSVFSIAIILERFLYYKKMSQVTREKFMLEIAEELKKGKIKTAQQICQKFDVSVSRVVAAGLDLAGNSSEFISNAMERQITIETTKLEKFTSREGTIASTSVYVGLFGTVLGIIKAFSDIAQNSGGGISVVVNGISEALVCTAVGLFVAIPALMAYNYFIKKISVFVTDMELCASETLDLLNSISVK